MHTCIYLALAGTLSLTQPAFAQTPATTPPSERPATSKASVLGADAFIGGGRRNEARGDAAVVSGGYGNTASGLNAAIAGGNLHTASGTVAAIAGGNQNTASAFGTSVGGGALNSATGFGATISGGAANRASGEGSTVGGGLSNGATGAYSTVSGGSIGYATAAYATVAGGNQNLASGQYSFAAGLGASAEHDGAFVWADSVFGNRASSRSNEFNVYAGGGVRLFSESDGGAGVLLAPGAGTWTSVSDRAAKENFGGVDPEEVLAGLESISISTWNYRTQDDDIVHIGPMAQDFHATFGLGVSPKGIDTVDADGVALAAIQGLSRRLTEQMARKDAEIAALREQVAELSSRSEELAAQLKHER